MDQKYEEPDLIFQETYQQNEILKVFEKNGNNKKYKEMDLKFEKTNQ